MSDGTRTGGLIAHGATLGCAATAMAVAMPQFSGTDPVFVAMIVVLLVLSLGIHEAAHGWVALQCGDPTARDLGRITLNPIPHIDLFNTILLPAMLLYMSHGTFAFGGAKPVPVNFHRLRHPWRDMCLVAIAGPLSNLLLAVFFLFGYHFFIRTGFYNSPSPTLEERQLDFLPMVLGVTFFTNVALTVFNLLPIPPLDGSRVMAWLLPQGLRESYVSLERVGMLLVFGFIALRHYYPGATAFFDDSIAYVSTGIDWFVRHVAPW